MSDAPRAHIAYTDPDAIVDDVIARVGRDIRLGVPLGLGKPNHIINAFYRRAKANPDLDLTIFTALSLDPPHPSNALEKRLAGPIIERLFGDYPRLEYVADRKRNALPENVDIVEFYLEPGAYLGNDGAQQDYIASNFTHVARDLADAGLNCIAQLVSAPRGDIPEAGDGGPTDGGKGDGTAFSLSSNSDITRDTMAHLREQGTFQDVPFIVQVNPNLPFMFGDAVVHDWEIDGVLDHEDYYFELFGTPNQAVGPADYMIGLYASALIRDGGTLQLGIGAISDAITYMLCRRDDDNELWNALLEAADAPERFGELIEEVGGTAPFERGLYGATEMMVPGFRYLYESDILRRRVYDDLGLQTLLDEGLIDHRDCGPETLEVLADREVVETPLSADDLAFLQEFGLLDDDVGLSAGELLLPGGDAVPADLGDPAARAGLQEAGVVGDHLEGGHLVHAGFFLGPSSFYRALREMDDADRRGIYMGSISFINDLYGDQELKMLQRKDARFVNSTMKVTLAGAAVSDGLAANQVVSGVGGQYNFVSMAHELPGGRSIIMLKSTYESKGEVESNIVWEYPHATIPRHLKDMVVTEYGIADLRGKTDSRVAKELLKICDSRFQQELLARAKKAGKVEEDWEIPEIHTHNTPERLRAVVEPARREGLCPKFPFGTELSDEEVTLSEALRTLQSKVASRDFSLPNFEQLFEVVSPPAEARPYLERMDLMEPTSIRERALQKAVLYGLSLIDAI